MTCTTSGWHKLFYSTVRAGGGGTHPAPCTLFFVVPTKLNNLLRTWMVLMHAPSRYIGKPTKLLYFLIVSARNKNQLLFNINWTLFNFTSDRYSVLMKNVFCIYFCRKVNLLNMSPQKYWAVHNFQYKSTGHARSKQIWRTFLGIFAKVVPLPWQKPSNIGHKIKLVHLRIVKRSLVLTI